MMRVLLLAVTLAGMSVADRLPPVDDSFSDASFLAFRAKLLSAIQRKDVKAVQAMADNGVRSKITPATLPDIAAAVRLGVARDSRDFIAPYVFVTFPKEFDAYTHAAAIQPAVRVRARAAATAPVVQVLDYDIVILAGSRQNGWVEIQTPSGKSGWVLRSELRTQLETRVFFEQRNGDWWITDVVSGD